MANRYSDIPAIHHTLYSEGKLGSEYCSICFVERSTAIKMQKTDSSEIGIEDHIFFQFSQENNFQWKSYSTSAPSSWEVQLFGKFTTAPFI